MIILKQLNQKVSADFENINKLFISISTQKIPTSNWNTYDMKIFPFFYEVKYWISFQFLTQLVSIIWLFIYSDLKLYRAPCWGHSMAVSLKWVRRTRKTAGNYFQLRNSIARGRNCHEERKILCSLGKF